MRVIIGNGTNCIERIILTPPNCQRKRRKKVSFDRRSWPRKRTKTHIERQDVSQVAQCHDARNRHVDERVSTEWGRGRLTRNTCSLYDGQGGGCVREFDLQSQTEGSSSPSRRINEINAMLIPVILRSLLSLSVFQSVRLNNIES